MARLYGLSTRRGPRTKWLRRVSRARSRRPRSRGLARAGRHELVGTVLQPLVEPPDRLERVRLLGRLVEPKVLDPGEPEREPRGVPCRTKDDVEGDLDHDRGLDDEVAAVPADRVLLEPAGHHRDLGVGEAAVGLADRHQATVRLVADGERVVGEHAVALA